LAIESKKANQRALIGLIVLTALAVPVIPVLHVEVLDGFPIAKLIALLVTCGVALTFWGLGFIRETCPTIRITPALVALGLFLIALFISSLFARDVYAAFFGEEYALLGFVVYGLFTVVVFLFTQTMTSPLELRFFAFWLIAVASLMAVIGILQSFGVDILFRVAGYEWLQDLGYSTAGNPDFLGFALVFPLLLAAGLALSEPRRIASLLYAAIAIMTTCVVLTTTRASWVAVSVGLLVLVIVSLKGRLSTKRIGILILIVLVGAGGAIARDYVRDMDIIVRQTLGATMNEFEDVQSGSALGGRAALWRNALEIIKENPVFGIGPGNYLTESYRYIDDQEYALSGPEANNSDPHGYLFFLGATAGMVGLALGFVTLAFAFGGSILQTLSLFRDRDTLGWIPLVWVVAMGALCINALAAVSEINGYLFFFIGLSGLVTMGRPWAFSLRPTLIKVIGFSCIIIGIIAFLMGSLTFASGVIQHRQAQRVPSEETLSRQIQAINIAPWRIGARTSTLYTINANPSLMGLEEYRLFVKRQWPFVRFYPSTVMGIANTLYANEVEATEILPILESILVVAPNRVDALAMKGALLIEGGEISSGFALISQAWEIELLFPQEHQSFAITTLYVHQLMQLERKDEAQTTVERALFVYPENPTLMRLVNEYGLSHSRSQSTE